MASASPLTASTNLLLSTSLMILPCRSAGFCSFPSRPARGCGAIRAMAEAAKKKKYKGTHVREKHLEEMIEKKVMEAQEACEGDVRSDECKVAWDEVEEVSQAKADLRRKLLESEADPLEHFCSENPETDECRVYED